MFLVESGEIGRERGNFNNAGNFYGQNICVPPNSYVETLIPSVL